MRPMMFLSMIVTLSLSLLIGCGSTSMLVPVTRPAEINLKGYNKIAVGTITGRAGQDLADDLLNALVNSGRFEVLDRQHLNDLLREQDLTRAGYADSVHGGKVGGLVGAAVMVAGRVTIYKYEEKMKRDPSVDKNGHKHVSNTRYGTATISSNLQLTNIATGRVITSKRFDRTAEAKTYGHDREPDRIDPDGLLASAREIVASDFMKKIAPYREMVRVSLLKDSDIPEFEEGIGLAERGEWERAAEVFKSVTVTHPGSDKAFYNFGVALEYAYLFPEALEALQKAYRLNADDDYQKEMSNVRRMESEQKRLEEQG